jgi:glycosyltransferase involved in cell wall biosynthesis
MTIKKLIKNMALKFGVEIHRTAHRLDEKISIYPLNTSKGHVALCHTIHPFWLKKGEPIPHSHAGHWRAIQIATTFLELNYSVDVIDLHNRSFLPEKDYLFYIDFYENLERLAPLMNPECIKILYIQMAHWIFHNSAQLKRLEALLQRRGICLTAKRQVIPHRSIEQADCAILHGNDFVSNTYQYANKPFYHVPQASPFLYAWPEDKDWEGCRKRFIWFGNHGFVHKGLDVVLEAFAESREYTLIVCGQLEREPEFVEAFYPELYQTPNIHTIGWVDTGSPEFVKIANSCVGIIHPSCSEGGSGSAIHCMHAGLIPIISYECGVDMPDFGVVLRSCSIQEIQEAIQMVASLPTQKLQEQARKAWEFVRANHTREKFTEEFSQVIATIAKEHAASN